MSTSTTRRAWYLIVVAAAITLLIVVLLLERSSPPIAAVTESVVRDNHELEDLQSVADQKMITLEQAIERYGWHDEFSEAVNDIRKADPDSLSGAAITGHSTAEIRFKGDISGDAQDVLDRFNSQNPAISTGTRRNAGFTERDAEDAVAGAYFAVLSEEGVQDAMAYFDSNTNEVFVSVKMESPPTDSEKSALAEVARLGALEATSSEVMDIFTVTLETTDHELSGTDSSSTHRGGEELTTCTSGFGTKTSSGTRGIMTAAHCQDNQNDDGDALTWRDSHLGMWGDIQWHTGPDTMGNYFYAGSATTTETKPRPVERIGTPIQGQTLCRNGKTSHKDCQDVRRVSTCANGACRLAQFEAHLSAGGDSGGSVYWGREAFGVHQGWMWAWFANREVFSRADYVDDAISGLSIATN